MLGAVTRHTYHLYYIISLCSWFQRQQGVDRTIVVVLQGPRIVLQYIRNLVDPLKALKYYYASYDTSTAVSI